MTLVTDLWTFWCIAKEKTQVSHCVLDLLMPIHGERGLLNIKRYIKRTPFVPVSFGETFVCHLVNWFNGISQRVVMINEFFKRHNVTIWSVSLLKVCILHFEYKIIWQGFWCLGSCVSVAANMAFGLVCL